VTVGKLGGVLLSVAVAGLAALLVYAWVDGGREPVRDIVIDIPVPGVGQ
jgi:hypothetical protein